MLEQIKTFFDSQPIARETLLIIGAAALSVLAYMVAKRIILKLVTFVTKKTKFGWDDVILEQGVFNKLALLAPAMVIFYLGYAYDTAGEFLQRAVSSYVLFVFMLAINDLLTAVNVIYNRFEFAKSRPIKGYIQVVKLVMFAFGAITILALIMGKSPAVVISGLGALTAVLMLVFKDTILSLVASIQLATNDSIRIGDWIEMPKFGADGDVIDIALNSVKIQNWDKTISSVPTHRFLEDSFKNWRGMSESGGRRIRKSLLLDQTSVKFLSSAKIDELGQIDLIKDYVKERRKEVEEHNQSENVDTSIPMNGRRLTNLGTFRQYVLALLESNPNIRKDMTLLVRLQEPTHQGIPLQIYCFSSEQRWAHYEALQGDIFDHLLAALKQFDLRVFQDPVGADFQALKNEVGQNA